MSTEELKIKLYGMRKERDRLNKEIEEAERIILAEEQPGLTFPEVHA